jgi:hypothetical protein
VSEFKEEKRCCTSCDAKRLCHVCGNTTQMACSDCRIDLGVTIYVCAKTACRDTHETKCAHSLKQQLTECLRERDRQYEFNAGQIVKQAKLETQLTDALKREQELRKALEQIVRMCCVYCDDSEQGKWIRKIGDAAQIASRQEGSNGK